MKRHWTTILLLSALCCTTAAGADGPLKIGVLADLSGVSSDSGGQGSVAAVNMAVRDFGGEVAGKRIVVLSADTQLKPDVASTIASNWFDTQGVDAIVNVPVSASALAVAKIARERNRLLMVTVAGASELTGDSCSPDTVHWAIDTNAFAKGTTSAAIESGLKSWFFISVDGVFGRMLENASRQVIDDNGGKVLGSVKVPLISSGDFSSFMLQAQSSGAAVVAISIVGTDFINAVRQAHEFGLVAGGQKLVGFLVYITDIHSLGLQNSSGLLIADAFYWDANDQTRAFAKRFMEERGVMPTQVQAMDYAATTNYLNAVKATGTTDTTTVVTWMKQHPAEFFGQQAGIRGDGRVMIDLALYQVKAPGESNYPWDYYKKVAALDAQTVFAPMLPKCDFVTK